MEFKVLFENCVVKKLLDQAHNLILFPDYSIFLDCLIITDKMSNLLSYFYFKPRWHLYLLRYKKYG